MKKFRIEVSEYPNCCCNICHRLSHVAKIEYYTQDYGSNKRKGKICKKLQKHPHSIWICEKCMDDFESEWVRHTKGLGFYIAESASYKFQNGEWVEREFDET